MHTVYVMLLCSHVLFDIINTCIVFILYNFKIITINYITSTRHSTLSNNVSNISNLLVLPELLQCNHMMSLY